MVHLLHPNPRNAQRYVWVVAANSPAALYGADVTPLNLLPFDYAIFDGHLPAFGQSATQTQTAVVAGTFDYNWRYSDALANAGDPAVRAKANRIRTPGKGVAPAPAALDRFAGRYRIGNDNFVDVRRDGTRLLARSNSDEGELLPQDDANFYLPAYGVWIAFQLDAAGKVTGFTAAGIGDFEATRLE
jgi:hypothetical protein